MNFYILTLFPEMVKSGLNTSILARAAAKGLIHIEAVNIRDYTDNPHGKVDDYTYGGGAGLLIQAQPVYDAWKAVEERIHNACVKEEDIAAAPLHCAGNTLPDAEETEESGPAACSARRTRVVYMTPVGKVFDQQMAREFAEEKNLILLCGHYEGIDERVIEEIVTDCISIGDFVLTGGEIPAMAVVDATARLIPGVLGNGASAHTDSFQNGLLEYPQYSRPEEWNGHRVPSVLLSGDHAKVDKWRMEQSVERTKKWRPDLYEAWKEETKYRTDFAKAYKERRPASGIE